MSSVEFKPEIKSAVTERTWNYRCPPVGLTSKEFSLCKQFEKNKSCRLGNQCVEAHGKEELDEWQIRWKIRWNKIHEDLDKNIVTQSFLQKLTLQCTKDQSAGVLFVNSMPFVDINTSEPLKISLSSKPASSKWIFQVNTSSHRLQNVALFDENHGECFTIDGVSHNSCKLGLVQNNFQEWNNNLSDAIPYSVTVTIKFKANVYGSFNQTLVLDFGCEQYISRQLSVDVYPASEGLELSEDGKQFLTVSSESQWTDQNAKIVRLPATLWGKHSEELKKRYPQPGSNLRFPVAFEKSLMSSTNYKDCMHSLLHIEELAQTRILSHFNLTGNIILTTHYLLSPGPLSTAKYCNGKNELFAKLDLNVKISEDTPAGRLILNNCNLALISFGLDGLGKRRAYECFIEDKTKDAIYLRLNEQLVIDFQLKHGSEFRVQAQFQLNRDVFCEKHWAIDMCSTEILFPDVSISARFEDSTIAQTGDTALNSQQLQAVNAIYSDPFEKRAPIVIVGPYGTGKTFTFAQCVKAILNLPDSRILVCTHSNSAADLYVKDYLHPLVQNGHSHCRPLRIFYQMRWLTTVHSSVLEYSLLEQDPTKGCSFRIPTIEEIEKHRVIVTTLATTSYLLQCGVKKGYFTHILIDEAAQCTECDVLIPLSLADENTRIALAGDHMQLSPEIFSRVAREQQFQVSLLERLYDHYPIDYPCRIVLCDNYRSHKAIVKFTSELFYDNRLRSIGVNVQHPEFYPLSFQVAKGQDIQDPNSTSIYNMAEIYEISEIVKKLQDNWPIESWGRFDENSIGVVSPYSDQVSRIRVHLRHCKLFGVNVERVLNVQGKQFRVIILSTVRTRNTCINDGKEKMRKTKSILKRKKIDTNGQQQEEDGEESDENDMEDEEAEYGFLSSARLLNTAITRARSLVVVIGDPLALCSVGRCRKLWERYIEVCRDWNSLQGVSWIQLRSHLDALEMKKLYGLNPMAPEFVPKKIFRAGQPLMMSQNYSSTGMPPFFAVPSLSSAVSGTLAELPPFPPPIPFNPNWSFPCSPRSLQISQASRPQSVPMPKINSNTNPLTFTPTPTFNSSFANKKTPPKSTFPQLYTSFQNVHLSSRFAATGPAHQFQESNSIREFDIMYHSSSTNRDASSDSSRQTHRAISKPLTVQQLEASLLKKDDHMASKTESWPTSSNNGSIWTPLGGPSLWDGAILSNEHEETNKIDSVPLYMRTSNKGTDANEEEDVPLWVHGVQEPDEDIESKTLFFEESVRRSLR